MAPSDPGAPGRLPMGEFVSASLPEPFGPTDRARATFRDGHVSFSATCNTMSGSVRVDDDVLRVDEVGGTEMGCLGTGHRQDEWLVDFFTGAPRLETLDIGFSLTSGDTVLRLLPPHAAPDLEPPASLQGTRWRLSGIETTDGDAVRLTGVGRVRADLRVMDGAIEFDNGCNDGGGDVFVERDRLRLGRVATTRVVCLGPGGEIERGVMAVLGERIVEWSISGNALRLSRGETTLLYDAR